MNTRLQNAETGYTGKKWFLLVCAAGVALLVALSAPGVYAAEGPSRGYGATGGFSGPGPGLVTVEQAKTMRDDSHVALKGHIIQSLGGEDYVFKDATGTINVEISAEKWQGQNVGPEDIVEIYGEVEKDWLQVEIDVERLVKL